MEIDFPGCVSIGRVRHSILRFAPVSVASGLLLFIPLKMPDDVGSVDNFVSVLIYSMSVLIDYACQEETHNKSEAGRR